MSETVDRISADQVIRLSSLREASGISPFQSEVPKFGWDKFKLTRFKYTEKHVIPPDYLFYLGDSPFVLNSQLSVAFGGTTSPVTDGFQLTELLAQQASKVHGAIIVSGGVNGVDTAAHLGALDVGGITVAVIANPVTRGLHPYVPKRTFLENAILQSRGLIVSEYDDYSADYRERLLQRDRLITALSDVFIAIECSKNSGTVDTANRAKIQGKIVVAVDWTKIRRTWREPKIGGNSQIINDIGAISFPSKSVDTIEDPIIIDEFDDILLSLSLPRG